MKLYVKQKVFSLGGKFTVKDEGERDVFSVRGEIFTFGRKLRVYDASGAEIAFIRAKLLTFLPRYFIEIGGQTYTLVKEFTFLRPKLRLEGLPWTMDGDFWAHEYALSENGRQIMRISKRWFTWGDSYELDVADADNALLCLCILLSVDGMAADASRANSSGNAG